MESLFDISAAAIGLLLLTLIVLFVCSFVGKWKTLFKLYFGFAILLFSHLLLFYLEAFGENFPLPAILAKYSIGALDFLGSLIHV
jgi:hypothetical protein